MSHATRGQEVLTFIDPGTGESLTFAERYPWLDPMGALMDYANSWLVSFWLVPVVALAIYVFCRSFEIAGRPSRSRVPPRNEWPFNDRQIFQIEHGADWFAPGWEGLFAEFTPEQRNGWLEHPESCRTCHGKPFTSDDVAEDHGIKVTDKRVRKSSADVWLHDALESARDRKRSQMPHITRVRVAPGESPDRNLSYTDIVYFDGRGADLRGVNFVDSDITHFNVEGADLRGAHFDRAHITHFNGRGAQLDKGALDNVGHIVHLNLTVTSKEGRK